MASLWVRVGAEEGYWKRFYLSLADRAGKGLWTDRIYVGGTQGLCSSWKASYREQCELGVVHSYRIQTTQQWNSFKYSGRGGTKRFEYVHTL